MFGRTKIDELPPTAARERQDNGAVLLDVRDHDEWGAGHAPNAVHIPLDELAAQAKQFESKKVLTICRSGSRSARAAKVLSAVGIDVRNVAGGMTAWKKEGQPVVCDDGSPGTVA